jgi:hypothetical protein
MEVVVSEDVQADVDSMFAQISAAADSRVVTHSSINTDDETDDRREMIMRGLRAKLYEKYPRSLVNVASVASGTISVSIIHP